MNFEDYLKAKKIDAAIFSQAEPEVFHQWNTEFALMHPNSFTMQKLNLINSIRRKYHIKEVPTKEPETKAAAPPPAATPGRPVIKPKPKF